MSTTTYAWGQPGNAAKWHIFAGTRSLCMAWLYGGADDPIDAAKPVEPRKSDCAKCVKAFNALFAKPTAEGGAA